MSGGSGLATIIRPASVEEVPAAVRLLREFAEDSQAEPVAMLDHLSRPAEAHYVAITPDGRVVGTTSYLTADMVWPPGMWGLMRRGVRHILRSAYRPRPGEVYMDSIAVEPEFRRSGLARELTRHLVDDTAARGYRRWTLLIASANAGARALAGELGFREVQVRGRLWRPLLRMPTKVRAEKRA